MWKAISSFLVLGALLIAAPGMQAQGTGASAFSAAAQVGYRAVPNITYITENNYDAKLDMYQARGQNAPQAPSFTCTAAVGLPALKRPAS
jgi:hypothetical protein